MNPKPLVFVDLDDTLFQTYRKQQPTPQHQMVTTDVSGQPLSYMSPKQQSFLNWLLESAEVVPVTARSVEGFKRVQIPFQYGAICSHGGTILDQNLAVDTDWFDLQKQHEIQLNGILTDLPDALHDYAKDLGAVRTWTLVENELSIYSVAKQQQAGALFLDQLVEKLPKTLLEQCYIHINGNNLAIIPHHVSKQSAVEFYIQKHDPQRERIILGWGDSLSDAGFLSCCDWFGMPKSSQLDKFLNTQLSHDFDTKGYLGHV